MKKASAGVLAVVLIGVLAGSALAQVPTVQVFFDASHTQTMASCGTQGTLTTLYVVMNNWNMNITGVDFSITYPPALVWLADVLPDPSTSVSIGQSPGGIAIAYANCCYLNGTQSLEVLLPLVIWAPCNCNYGPGPVVVGGYTPLGKTQPTAIRKEDFEQFSGIGMTSLICASDFATEPTTWGKVKALYR
ncbi:MAG TPA: hypothetical protein VJS69_13685 [Candidatus Krumholzibacteria bacterium]|nr:hypothetical protein [Candidatus Krumholzibacteria bacterium]